MWTKSLAERKEEIRLLMQYAVPEANRRQAFELLERYAADSLALHLLHNFYSHLPEGSDDAILTLRQMNRQQGTFLICASTTITDYLYVVTLEGAALLGTLAEGIQDPRVREFFAFEDEKGWTAAREKLDRLPPYEAAALDRRNCPVCLAAEGEYHTLGCPVEVCPWCGGQLTGCNCRFTQLGVEELEVAADVERFFDRLEEQGRIPYEPGQRPAYLSEDDEST